MYVYIYIYIYIYIFKLFAMVWWVFLLTDSFLVWTLNEQDPKDLRDRRAFRSVFVHTFTKPY